MSQSFKQWVVVDPDGDVIWTACEPRSHDYRCNAISAGCRMARYRDELKHQDDYAKKHNGEQISCDWDDYTWAQAYRRGFRVKQATLIVR